MENHTTMSELIRITPALQLLAAKHSVRVTGQCLRNWCRRKAIGRKVGGCWYVELAALENLATNLQKVQTVRG